MHIFGSRNWVSDERAILPAVGEYDGPQKWSNGLAPKPRPLPILVGSAYCVEFGGLSPGTTVPILEGNTCEAYPPECFGRSHPQEAAYDITCCGTQLGFAKVTNTSYQDIALAGIQLASFLGPGFTISTVPNSGSIFPGSVIAVGRVVVVVLPGTSNFQQLAFQILYAATGPQNFGSYSTNSVWQSAAVEIERRIGLSGYTSQTEFYFVGHSYGGAVASILAARMTLNRPNVFVNLMTFGSPYPGDDRLARLLEGVRQRHFIIDLDPVPGMPPRHSTLAGLFSIIGPLLTLLWSELVPTGNRVLIDEFGDQTETDQEYLLFALAEEIAQQIASNLTVAAFSQHFMQNYLRRLNNGCGVPKKGPYTYRVTTVGLTILFGPDVEDWSGSSQAGWDGFLWDGGFDTGELSWNIVGPTDYPDGAGFIVEVQGINPLSGFHHVTFTIPDAAYQDDTFSTDPPTAVIGCTLLTFTSIRIEFVPVVPPFEANPADIFP